MPKHKMGPAKPFGGGSKKIEKLALTKPSAKSVMGKAGMPSVKKMSELAKVVKGKKG